MILDLTKAAATTTPLDGLRAERDRAKVAGDRARAAEIMREEIRRVDALLLLEKAGKRLRAGTIDAGALVDALRSLLKGGRARTVGSYDFTAAFHECFGNCRDVVGVDVPTTYRAFFDLVVRFNVRTDIAAHSLGMRRTVAASNRSMAKARMRAALLASRPTRPTDRTLR